MNRTLLTLLIAVGCFTACDKPPAPTAASSAPVLVSPAVPAKAPDAVQQKLQEYSGVGATDCGRLDAHAPDDQSKAVSDCAMQANQSKHAFYVAYDMPGMIVGVAGTAEGKLFSVRSQGSGASAALTSGDCPSQLRVAASGRVTCFSPNDMGLMGGGHTAIPPGMPNPHAFPKGN